MERQKHTGQKVIRKVEAVFCLSMSVGGCVWTHPFTSDNCHDGSRPPKPAQPWLCKPSISFSRAFSSPLPCKAPGGCLAMHTGEPIDPVDSLRRRQKPSEAAPVPNMRVYTRCLCLCASLRRIVLNTTRVEAPWANAVLSAPPPVRAC